MFLRSFRIQHSQSLCMAKETLRRTKCSIAYKNGDLFTCSEDESLVHCVSADLRMGKGIAVLFKNKFGGISELKQQNQKTGGCAILKRDSRYIYYLVTKDKYFLKPTYETLQQSLETMKVHCIQKEVSKLSMPKIGCGLDKLHWNKVKDIIEETFSDAKIEITVYSL